MSRRVFTEFNYETKLGSRPPVSPVERTCNCDRVLPRVIPEERLLTADF